MKTQLFLFTIGPVQSFIAQARKAHDLHSGSQILSQLCEAAAKCFDAMPNSEIIFPDISSPSIPNRFLGKISCDPNQWAEIAKAVEAAVLAAWKEDFKPLAGMLDGAALEAAQQQIDQHLDMQWLFQELADDSDQAYRAAYDTLNKNLNAVKNARAFPVSEEIGRKCSLDGERNVIFYRKTPKQQQDEIPAAALQNGSPLYSTSNLVLGYDEQKKIQLRHLQPGEGLSAVSMLKRYKDFKAEDFPSTAEFALADTMKSVGKSALNDMTALFKPELLNWQVFYEDNLNKVYFEKQGLDSSKVEKAKKIQGTLAKAAAGEGRSLEKYYATVVFDGDHMGEWWQGKSKDKDRLQPGVKLEDFHKTLKDKLAKFAKLVAAEYKKDSHRGWVIYAGGDDFMGFFNLHHLGDALVFLRDKYQESVQEALKSYIVEGNKLTFSAGVCIAHYKEPLPLVLGLARIQEKNAKELRTEKDAIGITVVPGSGQTAEMVLPFEALLFWSSITAALQSGDFSNAFIGKARSELAAFTGEDGRLVAALSAPAHSLLERAISRACNLKLEEGESQTDFQLRKKPLVAPLQKAVLALLEACEGQLPAFFDALDIADFIERQTHISIPITETSSHETTI